MKIPRKLMAVIFLIWTMITTIMGLSYKIPSIIIYFPPHFHPRWALLSTPLLLLIFWKYIKDETSSLLKLKLKQNKIKEIRNKRFGIILLFSISYVLGIGSQMRFLPHSFHKFFVWISLIVVIYQSLELLIKKQTKN